MRKEIIVLGVNDGCTHVSEYLVHIRNLHHIKIAGDITIGELREALNTKHADDDSMLEAVKSFCDYQLETDGVTESSHISTSPDKDETLYMAYDVHTEND